MNLAPLAALTLALAPPSARVRTIDGRPALALESPAARVILDLAGGGIVDFRLTSDGVNPLAWDSGAGPGARPRGHFLCLDRWGQPSDAEGKNGMPFHGEATAVRWKAKPHGGASGEMQARLPMAGLTVRREASLSGDAAVVTVRETVTNVGKLGRLYNMVQHPTIAPPFLDDATIVDSNPTGGFAQGQPVPDAPAFVWPDAKDEKGRTVDIRRLVGDDSPGVASYVIDAPYGWITAASPRHGLLIGYFWKTSDYGWLNAWRNAADGRPAARGLEFGTTGLHQPFPVLVKQGKVFGHTIYEHLDAGESVTRSYAAFLLRIPSDYAGVASVERKDGALILHERGRGPERDLRVPLTNLP